MYPAKLKPVAKNYLWGGERLSREYGIRSEGKRISEAWLLSCHEAGLSILENGPLAGQSLRDIIFSEVDDVLGSRAAFSHYFPLLIKLIDAREDLSIQVHPNDAYAIEHGYFSGKTELWYILDAEPGAYIYYGFNRDISKEELIRHIDDKTLLDIVHKIPVNKGDAFLIRSGVIHGIGSGIFLAEIQQNSNTTFRVYDFDRKDSDGELRELHIDKALEVIDVSYVLEEPLPVRTENHAGYSATHLADCKYFKADYLAVHTQTEILVDASSFLSVIVTDGLCEMDFGSAYPEIGSHLTLKRGESAFLPASTGKVILRGEADLIITSR